MSVASCFLIRHAVGWGTAALAMLPMPRIASRVSWCLEGLLKVTGMNAQGRGWGDPHDALIVSNVVVNPLSPAPLLILGGVCAICVAGDLGRHRLPWLSWFLPFIPAVPLGLWAIEFASGMPLPADLPSYAPFVLGATVGVMVALLVGVYWWAMLLTARACLNRPPQGRGAAELGDATDEAREEVSETRRHH